MSILSYNKGNEAFRQGEYEEAESRYDDSLYYNLSKKRECKIRINYALSIVTPITPESVSFENLDESISRLEFARDILTEHDCAHEYDTNGHNKKAQTLKNEIDEYIEWLKENNKPPENSAENKDQDDKKSEDQNGENNKDDSMTDEEKEKARQEEEKEQQLKSLMEQDSQQGQEERFREFEYYSNWDNGLSFYDGQNW